MEDEPVGRLPLRPRLCRCLLVALVLVGALALAHATPPEPLWSAGVYDAADFDDLVRPLGSMVALPHDRGVSRLEPLAPAGGSPFLPSPSRRPRGHLASAASRAPPAA